MFNRKKKREAERMAALEAEVQELRARLEARDSLDRQAQANKPTTVRVGGLEVDLLPLSGLEWARAQAELPSFLLVYAAKTVGGGDVAPEDLERFVQTVRGWIRSCARLDGQPLSEAQLERLSVPEASVAARAVSAINGFDETLREFFRVRSGLANPGRDREALRGETQRPAARRNN